MTDDMHSTFAIEPWISGTPHSVGLVGLYTYGLDHRLPMLRHEQGNVEQDRIGDLPNCWNLGQRDVCRNRSIYFSKLGLACGDGIGSYLTW